MPEAEVQAIEVLRTRFSASTVYGQAQEYEFATKARNGGVAVEFLRLGQAVHACTGQDAEEMLRVALSNQVRRCWLDLHSTDLACCPASHRKLHMPKTQALVKIGDGYLIYTVDPADPTKPHSSPFPLAAKDVEAFKAECEQK